MCDVILQLVYYTVNFELIMPSLPKDWTRRAQ